MKYKLLVVLIVLAIFSCDNTKPDLFISGQIKGLKKGKLFLQKIKDSAIVNIDSFEFYGSNDFKFETPIEHPEIMYLQLQKDTVEIADNFISFFADKGQLQVDAKLKEFIYADVAGDYENQKQFKVYSDNLRRFGDQKLELIEAELEARKAKDENLLDSINKSYNRMNRRRYLYTINFAMGHPDLEISPYVVLNQAEYINTKYLDSVYQNLDQKIKNSFYGKKLNDLVTRRK